MHVGSYVRIKPIFEDIGKRRTSKEGSPSSTRRTSLGNFRGGVFRIPKALSRHRRVLKKTQKGQYTLEKGRRLSEEFFTSPLGNHLGD